MKEVQRARLDSGLRVFIASLTTRVRASLCNPWFGACTSFRAAAALLILLACASPVYAQEAEPHAHRLHLALTCSIAADIGDLLSTWRAFEKRPDAVEGNFLFGDTKDKGKAILIKTSGAVVMNGIAIWLHDDYPQASQWLLWGNCAWKSVNTGRNLWIARGGDTRFQRTGLAVKVSW